MLREVCAATQRRGLRPYQLARGARQLVVASAIVLPTYAQTAIRGNRRKDPCLNSSNAAKFSSSARCCEKKAESRPLVPAAGGQGPSDQFREYDLKDKTGNTPGVSAAFMFKPLPDTSEATNNVTSSLFGTKETLRLRAITFDKDGQMLEPFEGEYSKVRICALHSLQPRDLRKMDNTYSEQLPVILVRESAILVNLLQYKALIKANLVILAEPIGANSYTSHFLKEMSLKLKYSDSAYEFRGLETILLHVIAALQIELNELVSQINASLEKLNQRVGEEELKSLLLARRHTDQFAFKINAIRSVFTDILNQDEDLAAMYLTDKAAGKPHDIADHLEAELLFEHYLNLADEIANSTHQLSSNISATQAITNIVLDSRRNQLIAFEARATLATVAISGGALVAGLFGMNLTSGLESAPFVFWMVAAAAVTGGSILYRIAVRRMDILISSWGFKRRGKDH
ncbi:hypothetical protein DFS34DRAFT_645387 [Phlyctochytrium arcticum]|nr:hypothetical protein DFS34DRAFT_645387 [Phlyctochytrium arcticum]